MYKILKQFVFLVVLLSTGMYGSVLSYAAAPVFSNLNGDNPTIMVSSIGPLDENGDSTVTDSDSPNFNGGSLSIQLTSGTADGSFSLSGSGATGVSAGSSAGTANSSIQGGEIVYVDGVAIASVSAANNGQNGDRLILNFGSNATPARVQALIRALHYTAPTVGNRVFDITLSHGSEISEAAAVVISVVTPEIALQQGTTDITSGGSYNYGVYSINSDTDVIFTIANTGTGDLILASEIAINGENADQFSVLEQPNLTIAAGASTTFTVRFFPTSEGAKTAAIEIVSNDADEGSYTINLGGTAVAFPEMEVRQGTTNITSGGSYDFGTHSRNSDTDVNFTILNTGTADLVLTSDIAISGENADQFSVEAQPDFTIAAGADTTFTVRFSPTSEGNKTAAIEIVSNDSDEGSYTINLSGAVATTNTNTGSRHQSGTAAYKADVFEDGENTSSLTVNTNLSAKNVSVNLNAQMGADLMEGDSLSVNMPSIENMNSYSIEMEPGYLASKSGKGTLAFHTDAGTLTIPSNMLADDGEVIGTSIKITIADVGITSLSDEVNSLIGDRPIIRLLLEVDGKETAWSNSDAPVEVSIPYVPTAEELIHPERIVVWYIDGSGNTVCVPNGFYDADAGTVTFNTTHFSLFAVGYNPLEFNDVTESAWYSDYVRYLAARDIVGGNGYKQFRPDGKITRAEFVTILARLSGEDTSNLTSSSFSDVKPSEWYFTAIQWASVNDIVAGSSGRFNPNESITREQMTAMLYRYAEYTGTKSNLEGISPREFSDYGSIANWAQASVQWAVSSGIVNGNTDGSFAPQAGATRAQTAKMIALLLQNYGRLI